MVGHDDDVEARGTGKEISDGGVDLMDCADNLCAGRSVLMACVVDGVEVEGDEGWSVGNIGGGGVEEVESALDAMFVRDSGVVPPKGVSRAAGNAGARPEDGGCESAGF